MLNGAVPQREGVFHAEHERLDALLRLFVGQVASLHERRARYVEAGERLANAHSFCMMPRKFTIRCTGWTDGWPA